MTSEESLSSCLVLINVVPPFLFTVTPFPASPTNNLAVPSPSLGVCIAINVICGIRASKISRLFLQQYFLFQLAQLFIRGNSRYCFPKRWNGQMCHAHTVFRHPLCTFRGKLRTFPTVKSKTIGFLLHRTQKYTPVPFWRIPRELLPEK